MKEFHIDELLGPATPLVSSEQVCVLMAPLVPIFMAQCLVLLRGGHRNLPGSHPSVEEGVAERERERKEIALLTDLS